MRGKRCKRSFYFPSASHNLHRRFSMPPSKRQRLAEKDHISEERPTPKAVVSFENPSNTEKGLLKFPIELRDEVLHHFQGVNIYTEAPYHDPILSVKYLEGWNGQVFYVPFPKFVLHTVGFSCHVFHCLP